MKKVSAVVILSTTLLAFLSVILAQDDSNTRHFLFRGHLGDVAALAYSPDGRWIASGGSGILEGLKIYDAETGRDEHDFEGTQAVITTLAFSPDGKWLVSGGFGDDGLIVWDVASRKIIKGLQPNQNVDAVLFSPDGAICVSSTNIGVLNFWKPISWELRNTIIADKNMPKGGTVAIAFSPDSRTLAAGTSGGIKLWNPTSATLEKTLTGYQGIIWALKFSPDGQNLAFCGEDKSVRIWDIQTGKELQKMLGSEREEGSVDYSPDGTLLVSGGDEGRVRLWNPRNGKLLQTWESSINPKSGRRSPVNAVVFSPDGKRLAIGCEDGMVYQWSIEE